YRRVAWKARTGPLCGGAMTPVDVEIYREGLQYYRRLRDLFGVPERVVKEVVYALRGEDRSTHPSAFRSYPSDWEMWYLLDRVVVLKGLVLHLLQTGRDVYGKADRVFLALYALSGYRPPEGGAGARAAEGEQPLRAPA